MSRIRVVAARLYAAFIHAQLFVMSCRSKLTKFLLLIPMMISPVIVGLVWLFIYFPELGYFNYFIGLFNSLSTFNSIMLSFIIKGV